MEDRWKGQRSTGWIVSKRTGAEHFKLHRCDDVSHFATEEPKCFSVIISRRWHRSAVRRTAYKATRIRDTKLQKVRDDNCSN